MLLTILLMKIKVSMVLTINVLVIIILLLIIHILTIPFGFVLIKSLKDYKVDNYDIFFLSLPIVNLIYVFLGILPIYLEENDTRFT